MLLVWCPHCKRRAPATARRVWRWPWGLEVHWTMGIHYWRGESVYRGIACRGSGADPYADDELLKEIADRFYPSTITRT